MTLSLPRGFFQGHGYSRGRGYANKSFVRNKLETQQLAATTTTTTAAAATTTKPPSSSSSSSMSTNPRVRVGFRNTNSSHKWVNPALNTTSSVSTTHSTTSIHKKKDLLLYQHPWRPPSSSSYALSLSRGGGCHTNQHTWVNPMLQSQRTVQSSEQLHRYGVSRRRRRSIDRRQAPRVGVMVDRTKRISSQRRLVWPFNRVRGVRDFNINARVWRRSKAYTSSTQHWKSRNRNSAALSFVHPNLNLLALRNRLSYRHAHCYCSHRNNAVRCIDGISYTQSGRSLVRVRPSVTAFTKASSVKIGDVSYTVEKNGKTLVCAGMEAKLNNSNLSHSSASYIPNRVIIGGVPFLRRGQTLARVDNAAKKAHANLALQRSVLRRRSHVNSNIVKSGTSKSKNKTLNSIKSSSISKSDGSPKYCTFYNRFGKCKRGNECPFIHDHTKVAVCTRFLRGACPGGLEKSCPFSHEVSPDRMPVCAFFLRGECTATSCPYRHVRVSATAEFCLDFVRGHCADGDACLKKHTLICDTYVATNSCPRGSRCPLRHPKGAAGVQLKRKRSVAVPLDKKRRKVVETVIVDGDDIVENDEFDNKSGTSRNYKYERNDSVDLDADVVYFSNADFIEETKDDIITNLRTVPQFHD